VTRQFASVRGAQPHIGGFGHQVADGQNQSVGIDDDPVAGALRSQYPGGERVLGHVSAQLDDRSTDAFEIEP